MYYYAKGARTLKVEEECSRRRSNENWFFISCFLIKKTADVAVYRKWEVDNGRLYKMNEADHHRMLDTMNGSYNELALW